MKNRTLLIQIAMATPAILIISLFIWLFRANFNLRERLNQKSAELKKAGITSRNQYQSGQDSQGLEEKKETINKRVPRGEKYPLELIKTFTRIGEETGLKKMAFSIKEAKDKPLDTPTTSAGYIEGSRTGPAAPTRSGPSKTGLTPIEFEMKFEAVYPQLLSFLQKLMQVERLVTVNQIEIERKKELLPYQQITLQLTTYTKPS